MFKGKYIYKLLIIAILAAIILPNNIHGKPIQSDRYKVTAIKNTHLFPDMNKEDPFNGKIYLGSPFSQAPPTARWVGTTQHDGQHYTTPGRQIAYAGYYNPNCDYVYMDYTWRFIMGSVEYVIQFAIFDWSNQVWYDIYNISPLSSAVCNIDVVPDNGWPVVTYQHGYPPGGYWYTIMGYSALCDYPYFTQDSLPGPPNIEGIHTGFFGDPEAVTTPYLWPKIDVDTTDDGKIITHVAATKSLIYELAWELETRSLLYYRKVADSLYKPWTGIWEGAHFMDSAYLISPVVRADKRPDNHDVYYAYLKPLYYLLGSPHPCDPDPYSENYKGFYQITNEVVYRKSTDDGQTWGPIVCVTDYASGYENGKTEPAAYDLTAMVDPNGTFHLVWSSPNINPDSICNIYNGAKMWHWDNSSNCISLAYDASHPAYFLPASGLNPVFGAGNLAIAKHNISWCDDKLYITFTRFGANATGDTSFDAGTASEGRYYQNGDIMVICSDVAGNMGRIWSGGVNLTNSPSPNCAPGDCMNEHWPTMAMFSYDSLMIQYIEDKDPGAYVLYDYGSQVTDNPVYFLTWPCFSMADVGINCAYATLPAPPEWDEVALAPYGQTSGCKTPATYTDSVILFNAGNINFSYSATSDAGWLSIISGGSGIVEAGSGPRGSDDPAWNGAEGCAIPKTIAWQANSYVLSEGKYTGTIHVDITDPPFNDFDIVINADVTCFIPEWARILSGCWEVDVWNVPQAGHQDQENYQGNMKFYACGMDSTVHPLYNEALIVGWNGGSKCFSMMMSDEYDAGMRALDSIVVTEVGNPNYGQGYFHAESRWCTEDSSIYGTVEYYIPGHQDTAVLIEKVTMWNETGTAITDFLVGEGTDWDVRPDSDYDDCGFDSSHLMLYQKGCLDYTYVYAGIAPYSGYDQNIGGAVVDNHDYIYPHSGFKPDSIYAVLDTLEGKFTLFEDSCTDLCTIYRFWEGTLGIDDTLSFCKIKAVGAGGVIELQDFADKAFTFIRKYGLCGPLPVLEGTYKHNMDGYKPTDGDPVGSQWHELYPNYCDGFIIIDWIDNLDGILSCCDTLISINIATMDTIKEHIERVTTTITVEDIAVPGDSIYLDYLIDNPLNNTLFTDYLIGSYWHEVHPNHCVRYKVIDAFDNGNDYLDFCDFLIMQTIDPPIETYEFHILDVATDIIAEPYKACQGICGDANCDGGVNFADVYYLLAKELLGGPFPCPVLACGNVNNDTSVNVADVVWLINYLFGGGDPPGDCNPGAPQWVDGDCCPFEGYTPCNSFDPGERDTVRVTSTQVLHCPGKPSEFGVPITLYNDEAITAGLLGFYYNSDDVTINSVTLTGGCAANLISDCWANPDLNLAIVGFNVGTFQKPPISPGNSLLATLWFTLDAGAEAQTIAIDSGYYPPAYDFTFVTMYGSAKSLSPYFIPGNIIVEIYGGMCGDANCDFALNITDEVWLINYIFAGGLPPLPTLACGDTNGDGTINVADPVWIINYIFNNGDPPGDCSPGSPNWDGQDCGPFVPPK